MDYLFDLSIVSWLFLCLLCITISCGVLTAITWRKSRQSFHLYNRRNAEIQMQNYMTLTAVLVMFMVLVGGYLWIEAREVEAAPNTNDEVRSQSIALLNSFDIRATREAQFASQTEPELDAASETAILPLDYRAVDSESDLDSNAALSRIEFATNLAEDYAPGNPSAQFSTEIEQLFATFSYSNLDNGVEWAWVWRRDGDVIDGGNELWRYGTSGPAFVYLDLEEFEPGDYSAEIWLNETLFARSNVTIFQSASGRPVTGTDSPRAITVTTPELLLPPVARIGTLPSEYSELESEIPISSQTEMQLVDFAVQYGGENRPITLVAAFEHQSMADGMAWSWVWRRDGDVLGGGNRLWQEPSDARIGFMHFIPIEQLDSGEYSVELWVNRTLLSRAIIQVTSTPLDSETISNQ